MITATPKAAGQKSLLHFLKMSSPTDTCTWTVNGKKCWMAKTHWHPIYGELCAKHAAELMASGDKKVRYNRRKSPDPLDGIVLDEEERKWLTSLPQDTSAQSASGTT